jgi:hypothetical protein
MQSRTATITPEEPLVGGAKANPRSEPLEGEVLDKHFRMPERADVPPSSPLDIGAVITDALKAAGLMKGR